MNHGLYVARVTMGDTMPAKAHLSTVAATTHTTIINNKASSDDDGYDFDFETLDTDIDAVWA